MRRRLAIGGFLGLGAVALVWWLIREPSIPTDIREPSVPTDTSTGEGEGQVVVPQPSTAPEAPPEAEGTTAPPPSDSEARRQVAEALRAAIREARLARAEVGSEDGDDAEGATAAATAAPDEDTERAGTMDPEYIRDAVQEIRPLLAECYELAQDAAEREGLEAPKGRLVTRFVFTGEPDVGGVVEESEVLEESSLRDPTLEECFRETLYTLELPAPDEGGTITVHYPFELSNEPGEE